KMLYAAFRLAGLDAFFVHARLEDVKNFVPSFVKLPEEVTFSHHTFLGIHFGKKTRLFDPSLLNSNATYPSYQPQNLRHFFAVHESNRAGYLNSAGHPDQALLAARHAVEVDPKFPDSYFNLSVAYQERARLQSDPRQKSSDYAEAIQAAQRSVQLGRP